MKRRMVLGLLLMGLLVFVATENKSFGSNGYSELIFANPYTYTHAMVYLFSGYRCLDSLAIQNEYNRWVLIFQRGTEEKRFSVNVAPRPPVGYGSGSTADEARIQVYPGREVTALIVIYCGLTDIYAVQLERLLTPPAGRNRYIPIRYGSDTRLTDRLWWIFRK